MKTSKTLRRVIRHKKIRKQIQFHSNRPRLCVHRSLKHFQAQIVDDAKQQVLVGASTLNKEIRSKFKQCGNIKAAEYLGEVLAKKAKEKNITKVSFDRAGYMYYGRVKAFADSARKNGLEF
jgi:large subunit ribosomal protein L18